LFALIGSQGITKIGTVDAEPRSSRRLVLKIGNQLVDELGEGSKPVWAMKVCCQVNANPSGVNKCFDSDALVTVTLEL